MFTGRTLLIAVAVLGTSGAEAAPPQECATCDREVTFSKGDVPCLKRRLAEQLAAPRDPILISVQSCTNAGDHTRQEPVVSRSRQQGHTFNRIYLLTRADAACLSQKLKGLLQSRGEYHIKFSECR
jgi:hypothetical protein